MKAPGRYKKINFFSLLIYIFIIYFVIKSFEKVDFSIRDLVRGFDDMYEFIRSLFPPKVDRIEFILKGLFITFQMAVVGTVIGVLLSLPLSVFASRSLSPNRVTYHLSRFLISLFRTVPDIIWAIFFVITVGLGPFAGTLALAVDTLGFCGRFFAEAIEETDKKPIEALQSIGANKLSTFICAILPSVAPSFINSSLFSLEKAVRSSVVLGLVGAGGIGAELKVAMDMFQFAEAATIIFSIFLLVIVVEQISSYVRHKIIE